MMYMRLLIPAFILCLFSSCLSYKNIVNFQDGQDLGSSDPETIANYQGIHIQPDDILQITVYSYNLEEAQRFNIIDLRQMAQIERMSPSNGSVSDPIGYRVDSQGNIDMPVIGRVSVIGLTIEETRELIYRKISETGYLRDHNVQIRFLSFRITVLGEVNAPGTFTISSQRITVLEALGLARDLTLFAHRDNILVIREKDGKREYGRINVKSKEIFKSPYYYLQPNDIVYVEPHKAKILAAPDPASRYGAMVIAIVSLATLLITRF